MSSAPLPDWREVLIVEASLRTGLLAAFRDPATPAEVAERHDLDPRATRITALALADLGYLAPAGAEELAWADRTVTLLDEWGQERDGAARVHLFARQIALYQRLGDALLGAPPEPPWGDTTALAEFTAAMREVALERVDAFVASLPRPRDGARMLDIGGGPGIDAAAFASAGWAVTVLDLPEVLAGEGARLAEAGIAVVAGDATREVPPGPWDTVLIANVLHLLGREAARALVARAAATLAPGGRLAVLGVLRDLTPNGRLFAVGMLLATAEGDCHDSEEIVGWMTEAGLHEIVPAELGDGRVVLVGRAS
jgi:SAM-dependent methyltransferase